MFSKRYTLANLQCFACTAKLIYTLLMRIWRPRSQNIIKGSSFVKVIGNKNTYRTYTAPICMVYGVVNNPSAYIRVLSFSYKWCDCLFIWNACFYFFSFIKYKQTILTACFLYDFVWIIKRLMAARVRV